MGEQDENGNVTQGQDDTTTDNVVEETGTSNEGQTTEDSTEGHPAWQEILNVLPDEFHPLVTPKLKDWDSGVQTRFQNLQSQYEPYKAFLENDVDPEYLQQAIGLAAAIDQDPERVYKALAEAYGYDQGVADTTSSSDNDEDDDDIDPIQQRLDEQERLLEKMAETFLQNEEAREESEYSKALDEYMGALHEAYDKKGGFDDNYVLNLMAQGVDGEKAVEQFQDTVTKFATKSTNSPKAPVVMGSSGGTPSNRTDPRNLGDADTRDIVAQLLKQANEE